MKHTILNGDRVMTFEGELLASSTSFHPGSYRWLEVAIYRTDAGNYIYQTIGRSRVFKLALDERQPGAKLVDSSLLEEMAGAGKITVGGRGSQLTLSDVQNQRVIFETDRHRAVHSISAEGVVEAAKVRDRENILFLTKTAEECLRAAAAKDEGIQNAFFVEHVS